MRILALADTHLGFKYGYSPYAKKLIANSFFQSYKYVIKKSITSDVDLVLHGGDVFDRSSPKPDLIKKFFDPVDELIDREIQFAVAPGNHERSVLPNSLLQYFSNDLHIFNKLSVYEVPSIDLTIIGFPYTSTKGNEIMNVISKIARKSPKKRYIILCHQSFSGATFGPHKFVFKDQEGVINNLKLPKNVICIITGHIHRAQKIETSSPQVPKIYYTGSTEKTTWFEAIEPKGYLTLDIEEDFHKINFVEIPSHPMNIIEMNVYNQKIDYCDLEDLKSILEKESMAN